MSLPDNNTHSTTGDPLADPRVARVVAEYQEALEAGARPVRSDFVRRFPELSNAVDECLRAVEFVHGLAGFSTDVEPPRNPSPLRPGVRFGEFQIVREVGRGGMGVVFEAVQIPLNRRVALKILPAISALDDRARARFQNEARAVGGLHHPHIVPVYAVGQVGEVHYFCMQFVDGPSLAAVLRSVARPAERDSASAGSAAASTLIEAATSHSTDYYRTVARLIRQAADALHHAHECGVVHRDVKPGNLLLDPVGNLWVVDFGLARLPGSDLTGSADVLGTLRYMSPEQASGKATTLDGRGDVYSLGVTLYELLALRPAFPADDREALLNQVLHDEPAPLRRVAPGVPADLETITRKATAKEPGDRYSSAAAFRDDLARFLDDRPIEARPPTVWQRGGKWAKRNRAVVGVVLTAAFVSLAATAAVAAVAAGQIAREKGVTDEANGKLRESIGHKDRALYTANVLVARKAQLDSDLGKAARFLDACPEATRDWEWYYLRSKCSPSSTSFRHLTVEQLSHGISADGSTVMTGLLTKGVMQVYRLPAGPVTVWPDPVLIDAAAEGFKSAPADSELRPDGTRFLAQDAIRKFAVVWDTSTGSVVSRKTMPVKTSLGPGGKFIFGPFGLEVLKYADGTLVVWDVEADRERVRVQFPESPRRIHYCDGYRKFVIESPGRIEVRDGKTGRYLAGWSQDPLKSRPILACSPTGTHLAEFAVNEVDVREIATGKLVWTLRGHYGQVGSAAFSPDGARLATGDNQRTVTVWDLTTGRESVTVRQNAAVVKDLAFRDDGYSLVCGCMMETRIWDTLALRDGGPYSAHRHSSDQVAVSPDGKRAIVSSTRDGGGHDLRVVELPGERELRVLSSHPKTAFGITPISADGRLVAVKCPDGIARVWDLDSGEQVFDRPCPRYATGQVRLSPDGKRVAIGESGKAVAVFDLASGTETHRFPPTKVSFRPVMEFSPRGDRFVVNNVENAVTLYDMDSGNSVVLRGHGGIVSGIDFPADGSVVATASWDGTVRIWDATDGALRAAHSVHASMIYCLAYHPSGTRLAVASQDKNVRVLNAENGEEYVAFSGVGDTDRLQFTADGKTLLGYGGGDGIRAWRADSELPATGYPERWYAGEVSRLAAAKWFESATWFVGRLRKDGPEVVSPLTYGYVYQNSGMADRGRPDVLLARFSKWTSITDPIPVYQFAGRLLLDDDRDKYRQLCAGIATYSLKDSRPFTRSAIFRLLCLGPNPQPLADEVVGRVREHLSKYPDPGVYDHVLGMALFRAGATAEAIRSLEAADKTLKSVDGAQAINWLYLALACQSAGRPEDAAAWLAKADAWYAQACAAGPGPKGQKPIEDRAAIAFPVLRREAAAATKRK